MELRIIHNPSIVYEYLKNKPRFNYVYQFSNLTIREWEKVICFGLFDHSELKEIAMLSTNCEIPVLLAASFENLQYNIELLKKIKIYLPAQFYTHIDREVLEEVFSQNHISEFEEYVNMGLDQYHELDNNHENIAVRLGFNDLTDIKDLISVSYPGAWLDDELVKLNENFGIYDDGKLISFAGIHAYSEEFEVAAVAHVTTHPDYRKRGYGEKVVKALTNSLKNKIKFIGLNVKVDNLPAIKCYKKLGFKKYGKFVACVVDNISENASVKE
ncbi:GNAT family N-acetyltransferase [Oceanirhabdus sp. W0125-5]|uniref:GNAT family N-acetyltransferase n=1 Tax=Oceanirhabdus sp. W0125-5 TaxID=2999116 RepID=UPI0022F31443|nr:GNAT family N-acetyltransferase [Oceanirhabdus sp. W0125-5]WBW95565.1 GNAT family N-acetyltransferase [Oceanirhabdus sp. W0125-5]